MATLTSSTHARTAGGVGAEQNYELNQSDSIDFCFNLMSDPHAHLSQTDIMDIFNSLQRRERDLPFLVNELGPTDAQGVRWPPQRELRRKFDLDRARVGRSATGWFRSLPSRARVRHVCTGDCLPRNPTNRSRSVSPRLPSLPSTSFTRASKSASATSSSATWCAVAPTPRAASSTR